jgi:hypothetical protein
VRREEVHVEDPSNPRVHVEGERGMTGRTGATDTAYGTDRTGNRSANTTDTAYDRTGMAGDRYETDRPTGEGIIDRAKDKMRDDEGTMRKR